MFLHHSHIVTHPDRHFENVHAARGANAGEGVPHGVGSYPFNALTFHVFAKRAAEIVTVTILAVLCLGMQHVGATQSVLAQESGEGRCEGQCALFSILEAHGWSFAQVQQACIQVEPFGNSLDNLATSQPGMKTAVENEAQIFAWTFVNQFLGQLWIAKVLPCFPIYPGDPDPGYWITPDNLFVHTPAKKASDRNEIAKSTGRGEAGMTISVESLYVRTGNIGGSNLRIEPREEQVERVGLIPRGGAAENIHVPLVRDESLNQSRDLFSGIELREFLDFLSPLDCLRIIGGFEADKCSDFLMLAGKPVDVASYIYTASGFHSGDCRTFTVTLSNPKNRLKGLYASKTGERVTRFELATSSLARLLPVEGTVTLRLSHTATLPVLVLVENTSRCQLRQCCSIPDEARESISMARMPVESVSPTSRGGQFISADHLRSAQQPRVHKQVAHQETGHAL